MSEEKKKPEFGIWKKSVKMRSGEVVEVLSFSVNGQRYTAWPNTRKQSEKSPDFNTYVDNYVKPDAPKPQPQQSTNDLPF